MKSFWKYLSIYIFVFPIADNFFIMSILYFWISKIHLLYTFNLWSGKNWECNHTLCTHVSTNPVKNTTYVSEQQSLVLRINMSTSLFQTCGGNKAPIKLNLGVFIIPNECLDAYEVKVSIDIFKYQEKVKLISQLQRFFTFSNGFWEFTSLP